jgi:hypothetical protein
MNKKIIELNLFFPTWLKNNTISIELFSKIKFINTKIILFFLVGM